MQIDFIVLGVQVNPVDFRFLAFFQSGDAFSAGRFQRRHGIIGGPVGFLYVLQAKIRKFGLCGRLHQFSVFILVIQAETD